MGVAYGAVAALKPDAEGPARIVSVILFSFWMFYFCYGIYLYYLVSPLAILRKEPVLKTSAQMTVAELWRIFWGTVVLWFVLFFLLLPFGIVSLGLSHAFGEMSSQAYALSALMGGVGTALTTVTMAVYACVAYRILSKEQSGKA
jgi:hypothetical protein